MVTFSFQYPIAFDRETMPQYLHSDYSPCEIVIFSCSTGHSRLQGSCNLSQGLCENNVYSLQEGLPEGKFLKLLCSIL